MRTVKLLKEYLCHKKDEIIAVDNNIAHGLIEDGTATADLKTTREMNPGTGKKGSYRTKHL